MEKIKSGFRFEIDESLKQEMLEEYRNTPTAVKYVKKLGITEEDIDKYIDRIYDFVCDVKYCENCPGIKACQKTNPLLCTKLVYVNGIVDRELTPCKNVLKKMEIEDQFRVIDFDREWLDVSIKDVDNSSGRAQVVSKFKQFVSNKYDGWLYVTGGPNSGRTFLTAVLCNKLIAAKELGPICFLNAPERIKQLSDFNYSKEKDKFDKTIELYSSVPVLVLDDFGNGFISDYIRDAIIQPILAKRAQKRLFTIFTSDYQIDEIGTLLTTNQNAGALRAEQIRKIIKNMCGKEINLGDLSIY